MLNRASKTYKIVQVGDIDPDIARYNFQVILEDAQSGTQEIIGVTTSYDKADRLKRDHMRLNGYKEDKQE